MIGNSLITQISDVHFRLLRDYIHEKSGIYFNDNKKKLLQNRLLPRLLALNFETFEDYYFYLKFNPKGNKEFKNILGFVHAEKASHMNSLPS